MIPVPVDKVAMVQETFPDKNYGASPNAQIVNWLTINNHTLLYWDLSSYASMSILDAQLAVYKKYDFPYTQSALNLYEVSSTWNEGTLNGEIAQNGEVTWNNQPAIPAADGH